MKKSVACLVGVLTAASALSACSSPQSNEAGGPPSSTTTQAATTGEAKPANPGTGIIEATTMTSCDTTPGKVTAKGTVTPPGGAKGAEVTQPGVDVKCVLGAVVL